MMRWIAVGVVVLVACSGRAPVPEAHRSPVVPERPPPEPAFDPPAPALRLPTHFVPASYNARLAVDPALPGFTGEIAIIGELTQRSWVIWLHGRQLKVKEAHAERGGIRIQLSAAPVGDDLLELRAREPIERGPLTIRLEYEGVVGADVRGLFRNDRGTDQYLISYFEPVGARRVFPCFDEPDRKTPWTLTLDVPAKLIAVSNTPIERSEPIDPQHVRVAFATTKPLPTYLVAFGVGPFEIIDAGKAASGLPLRLIVPRGTSGQTAFVRASLPRIVDNLEGWFGIPFPYPKLDILAAPSIGGGAMEHAGLITADARYVLLDPAKMSWGQQYESVSVLGHETSHQWFGDLVTPPWWNETWLKESFATWMEPKITSAFDPSWHDEMGEISRRNGVLTIDSQATARQIRQPIKNAGEIGETYDGITYGKGGTILRMFEQYVGADAFQRGVRAYLQAHAHGTAVAADLVSALEQASGKPLAAAFATFLDQPGAPVFDVSLACAAGTAPAVTLTQNRYLKAGSGTAGPTVPWQVPVCLAYDRDGKRADLCSLVSGATAVVALPATSCPRWMMSNAGGLGYYYTALTADTVTVLRDKAWPVLTGAERRVIFEDVRERVTQGALPVALLMSLVPKLAAAGDRFVVRDVVEGSGMPWGVGQQLAPDLEVQRDAWVRKTYGKLARARGFETRPTDGLDDEVTRKLVVPAVAWAGDRALIDRAVVLAARYRDLPQSVRELVLPLAANASPAIAAQIKADVVVETDHDLRTTQLFALGSIEDPARAEAMLGIALESRIPNEDVVQFLYSTRRGPANRAAIAWMRRHMTELLARFPKDDTFAPFLTYAFDLCEAEHRDEMVAFLEKSFGPMSGAAKLLRQRIEFTDQCIAQRALVEPSVRAWLKAKR